MDYLRIIEQVGDEIKELRQIREDHPFKGTFYGIPVYAISKCPPSCLVIIKTDQSINYTLSCLAEVSLGRDLILDGVEVKVEEEIKAIIKDYNNDPSIICLFMSSYVAGLLINRYRK